MTNNIQLKWKISFITIFILMILMLSVSLVIYNYTANVVKEEVNKQIYVMNRYQRKILDDLIYHLRNKMELFKQDNTIKGFLNIANNYFDDIILAEGREKEDARQKFNNILTTTSYAPGKRINELIRNIDYARFAYLVLPEGTIIADSRVDAPKDIVIFKNYIGKAVPSVKYESFSFGKLEYVNGIPYLIVSSPLFNGYNMEEPVGYVVLGLSIEIFSRKLNTELKEIGSIILANKDGIILNHQNKDLLGKPISNRWFMQQIKNNRIYNDIVKEGNYYIINKIGQEEIFLLASIPLNNILIPAQKLKNIILFITLLGMIIMFMIVAAILSWQLKPLNKLLNKIDKVREGNLETKIDIKSNDEIGKLARNFNKMVVDIKGLLREQEEIRKYELKALQSQINRHFFYNTLDSIYWMTKTREYYEIGEITIALSHFFRLALNDGKDINTVQQEVEHVENYILIQKLRNPVKFDFEIDVSKDIYNNECIKLILQPLVENSLLHGLKHVDEGGYIKITGEKGNNKIILRVEDNGSGIDMKKLNDFFKKDKASNHYYALKNINKRIQLYYGSSYGLNIVDVARGACVEVYLPIKPVAEQD